MFAAPIDLKFEFELVALIKCRQPSAFHRRNMDERIRLAVIALNEAKAFHGVEEFDGARRLLAGQLLLRSAVPASTARRIVTITRRTTIGRPASARHRF